MKMKHMQNCWETKIDTQEAKMGVNRFVNDHALQIEQHDQSELLQRLTQQRRITE